MFHKWYAFFWGSLRGRLILSVAVVHALVMTFFIVDLTVRQRALLMERQVEEAEALAESFSTSAGGWISSADISGLQEIVDAQKKYPELIFALIADRQGHVLAHTDRSRLGSYLRDLPFAAKKAMISRMPEMVDVAMPVFLADQQVGWVRVGMGQKVASRKLEAIVRSGVAYALVAIFVGSVIAWFLGYWITRRLYVVQETIEAVHSGDNLARALIVGTDEAAVIAREFNSMLDALAERDASLRESEARFYSLFEYAPLGYQSLDEEGHFIEVNRAWLETLGYNREEVIGKWFGDFLAPEFVNAFRERFPVFKAKGQIHSEFQMLHKNGSRRFIAFDGRIGHKADGSFRQTHCILSDITDRKRTEEALRGAALYSRGLLEASLDPLVTINVEGKITDVNVATEKITGINRKRLIGTDFSEYFTEPDKAREGYQQVFSQGIVRDYPLTVRHVSGRTAAVLYNASVYKDPDGKVQGVFAAARDITERKRIEVELLHARDIQFKTLMELLPAKVFLKKKDSSYVSCNAGYAADLNIKPEEIAGKTDYDFFPTHLAQKYRDDDLRIMKAGKIENLEEEYSVIGDYLAGAQKAYISIIKAPVRDESGQVMGLLGLFWDITEKKALEMEKKKVAEAEVLTEMKSRFTSMVSHELRSPLAVVKEALAIVLEEVAGGVNEEQKKILGMAKRSVDRLGRLINNVLDFQKIALGKMEFNIVENDLSGVLEEVKNAMDILAKRKSLDLRVVSEEGLSQIKFDRDRIIQVLTNLVNNAIANTETGSVILAAKKENNVVHISVQDSGGGILAADIPKLFQPFEQVDSHQAKKKGGTGLGLAISKEIVLGHHGEIWAESEVGKGSIFHFTLPL